MTLAAGDDDPLIEVIPCTGTPDFSCPNPKSSEAAGHRHGCPARYREPVRVYVEVVRMQAYEDGIERGKWEMGMP